MKVIVLAAGYATRLYPLTLDRPKGLLPVAGRPMVEHVLESLKPMSGVDRYYLVTNARFAQQFQAWADGYRKATGEVDLMVVNDGTTEESSKLGAIGDLHLVLTREHVDDDVVVVAGDNLFSETLERFGRFGREKSAPVVATYDVGDLEQVKKYNEIVTDSEGRITWFHEKPQKPVRTVSAIALYFYPRATLPMIKQYVLEGNNPDQPGRLVEWLYRGMPVYTWRVPGLWFDIGSKESLEEANRAFGRRNEKGNR